MIRVGWAEDTELNFAALVILDEDSGDTIEFQRSLSVDEQDRALGMDTYCLVRGAASHYGGLDSYSIDGETLVLSLSVEAARALELPQSFELELGSEGTALARQHLPSLISDE